MTWGRILIQGRGLTEGTDLAQGSVLIEDKYFTLGSALTQARDLTHWGMDLGHPDFRLCSDGGQGTDLERSLTLGTAVT